MERFLLSFCFICILSYCFGQSRPDDKVVTYAAYNKPLKIVLKELSKIGNVNIIYSESRIPAEKPVIINATNEKLGGILAVILDDFGLTYQIVGDQLVLIKNESKNNTGDVRIYGYIRDKLSGEYLIGANVFIHDRSRGTATNENGFFSMSVGKQEQRFHFSYLGYKSEMLDIYCLKDTLVNIKLQPDGLLNEIIIMDDLLEEEHEQTASQQNLHIDKIQASNHLVGEADLFRYIAIQPGVTSAAEGIGGLNVRGGSADQNLVLLDGVPLYNTGHALGIFSVFNANAIKSASFYKGGIPARYAGRLSSVIDVHTKDGNIHKVQGEATLSTIALKASLEGPIIKEKASFLLSYRRTFMDVWIKEFTKFQNKEKKQQGEANYFFSDFNLKLNFDLSKKTRLLLQTLHSNDDFQNNVYANNNVLRDENNRSLVWGNKLYSLRLHSQWGKSLFSKTSVYLTGYQFESFRNKLFELVPANDTITFFDASLYQTSIRETGVRQEFDWLPSSSHTIKAGIHYQDRYFSPAITNVNEKDIDPNEFKIDISTLKSLYGKEEINAKEINIYVEDLIALGSSTSLNAGINYSIMPGQKKYSSFQPRLAFLVEGEHLHFKTGISRMQQYMHLLSNNGLGFPSDVWLPSSPLLSPQKSWILNTAFGYRLNSGLKFGMEAYYKSFDKVSSFNEGASLNINENIDWQYDIPIGNGYAYGLEMYAEKVIGKTLFGANYTYSISDRRFEDLNIGRTFPFGLNRNHSFKFSFTYRLSDFSEFLLNWSYMTGNYYSQPINVTIDINGKPIVLFPEKNNAQYPAFHRMDVGFSFYNTYKWGRAKFFLGLYNAYNRNNPFYTELVRDKENDARFEFKQFSLLPLLPTISYSISF